jgi:hypothetical protein
MGSVGDTSGQVQRFAAGSRKTTKASEATL